MLYLVYDVIKYVDLMNNTMSKTRALKSYDPEITEKMKAAVISKREVTWKVKINGSYLEETAKCEDKAKRVK